MNFEEIVLVEDDPDHAHLIQSAFVGQEPPLRIIHADSGEKAINVIESFLGDESGPLPKLFLIDINLPGINGIDVVRRIRTERRLRGVPVVMLTSSRASSDILRSYEAHANSYVIKPTSFEGIEATMMELRSYWTRLNVSDVESAARNDFGGRDPSSDFPRAVVEDRGGPGGRGST